MVSLKSPYTETDGGSAVGTDLAEAATGRRRSPTAALSCGVTGAQRAAHQPPLFRKRASCSRRSVQRVESVGGTTMAAVIGVPAATSQASGLPLAK